MQGRIKTIKENATIKDGDNVKVPKVGMIYFFFDYQAKGFLLDRLVTHQLDKIFNWSFLDAIHTGKIDVGVFPGPKIRYFSEGRKRYSGLDRHQLLYPPDSIVSIRSSPGCWR